MEKTTSPLERLAETNQTLLKRRPRKAKPIKPSEKVEQRYRGQLRALVRGMAQAVDAELTPVLRSGYTADSPLLDRILAIIARLTERFTGVAYANQAYRLAQSTLSMAEAETTAAFVSSVNRAVGVDMTRMIGQAGIQDYLDAAVAENVALIKSISSDYFGKIEYAVLNGMRSGESTTVIAKRIQKATGATYKRAKFIARDQTSKINADISRKRQLDAGITRFKWLTAKDVRVSGNPAGKYPAAKIKCYEIAKRDIGYGPGVYLVEKGASYAGETGLYPGKAHINCRCATSVQIEGFDY